MGQVVVSEEFIQEMFELERDLCQRIARMDAEETLNHLREISAGSDGPWGLVSRFLPQFQNPKLLEVGSGYGWGLCGLLSRGLDAVGIEPGREPFEGRYDMALKLLRDNNLDPSRLHQGIAETLPFPDNTFDIVYSTAVIEHVQDPAKAMDEMARVLKPGGVMLTHVPNYHSFYEGHYRILWLPFVLRSKRAARFYVERIHGRDPSFVDTLNFVHPGWFASWARSRRTSLRSCPVLPLLGRWNLALSMTEQGLVPSRSASSWLDDSNILTSAMSTSCDLFTRIVFSFGLSKELIVVWWKERAVTDT